MAELIDQQLVREQFGALDAETAAMLVEAMEADLREWSKALITAWQQGDKEKASRARHSLKGLCGNFGASELMALAEGELSGDAEQAALKACLEQTITAIRATACHA
ncbi:Hpt domain-containing protein [Alteraurantiacibacter aquimixticola]|nr:Hpt domain-containing protein [Alteraurantiacibacter aquimixticola]